MCLFNDSSRFWTHLLINPPFHVPFFTARPEFSEGPLIWDTPSSVPETPEWVLWFPSVQDSTNFLCYRVTSVWSTSVVCLDRNSELSWWVFDSGEPDQLNGDRQNQRSEYLPFILSQVNIVQIFQIYFYVHFSISRKVCLTWLDEFKTGTWDRPW